MPFTETLPTATFVVVGWILQAALTGAPLARWLEWDRHAERVSAHWLFTALLLGFAIDTKILFLLACVGKFEVTWIVSALAAAATLAQLGMASLKGRNLVAMVAAPDRAPRSITRQELLPWGVLVAVSLLALSAAVLAPRQADALRYHLMLPNCLSVFGRLQFFPDVHLALMADGELLYGGGLLLGGLNVPNLLNFAMLVLLGYATLKLSAAMRRDSSERDGVRDWWVVALTVSCPVIFWNATATKPDIIALVFCTWGLLQLASHLEELDWRRAILAGVLWGEAAAIKHTYLLFALCVLLVTSVVLLRRRAWKSLNAVVLAGLVIMVIPFGWYWLRFRATGNPFWPVLDGLSWDGGDLGQLRQVAAAMPFANSVKGGPLDFARWLHDSLLAYPLMGLGLWLVPWSLAWLCLRGQEWRHRFLAAIAGLFLALLYVSSRNIRFFAPAVPLLAVLAVEARHSVLELPRRWRLTANAVFYMAALLLLGQLLGYSQLYLRRLTGRITAEAYLRTTPNFQFLQSVRKALPADALVGVALTDSNNFYLQTRQIPIDPWFSAFVDYRHMRSPDQLVAAWDRLGLTHVVLQQPWAPEMDYLPVAFDDLTARAVAGYYEVVLQDTTETLTNRITGTKRIVRATLYRRLPTSIAGERGSAPN
ncbi:MAG: DUF2029 domain-containing protein [Opitutae bacterium]|nr:DUF2029 domain-containing protein [Opitutae bacterium]